MGRKNISSNNIERLEQEKRGLRIKNIRENELKMNKTQLAKEIGVSSQFLGLVEEGKGNLAYNSLKRLRNISGTDNIVLEAQYITDSSFNITEKSKIVLKFSDDTFLDLYYTSLIPKTDTEVIYGTSIYFMDTAYVDRTYSIQAENKITNMKTITDIRVETAEGFRNFKVKESAANDIIRLYNEMKELLSK